MSRINAPEVWLRGPVAGIPSLLQPVAHALLQAQEEVNEILSGFPSVDIWKQPAGVASVGFHLQHITGVIDRMFTYANGEQLTDEQLNYLTLEGRSPSGNLTVETLLSVLNGRIEEAIQALSKTSEGELTEYRSVGRKRLPSTVIGLLFHAAEHTMRHTGQLFVTVKILNAQHLSNAHEEITQYPGA